MSLRISASLSCFVLLLGNSLADPILPSRAESAPGGEEFAKRISGLNVQDRERAILAEIAAGNVPDSWRKFARVKVERSIDGVNYVAELSVAPDYLAIGSDEDHLLTPLTPRVAQEVADRLGCILPIPLIVDAIYRAADLKLIPSPIPPSAAMVNVETWVQHQETIRGQVQGSIRSGPLIAGHKKDVVVTNRLAAAPGKVAIYGWHRPDGTPIQPLYLGHTDAWVDYSHGIRLVAREMKLNGEQTTVERLLADSKLCALLNDEGVVASPRYLARSGASSESNETLTFDPGVRIVINSPATIDPVKPVRLVIYAVPSGNSIEQTIGRRTEPGDDWHFNIQHIGAQTRWLRERLATVTLVVAYLECEGKSWPAWRKKHDPKDEQVGKIVEVLRQRFPGREVTLVLTGHSGGGSFTFGFLNGVEQLPDYVERIAFLDSNYAYDSGKAHGDKLAVWLTASDSRRLTVIAYEDYVGLLNGKTFVSENGGSWGRSRAMLSDLSAKFEFSSEVEDEWERHGALNGRVKFLMRKNPEKAVLHTRLVELNGFIHAMVTGTDLENRDYEFFGPRAYERFIEAP